MAIRTYVAINNEIVKEGIINILAKNPFFTNIDENIEMEEEYIKNIEKKRPNIVFIESNCKQYEFINKVEKIKKIYPKIYVVMIIINENEIESYHIIKDKVNAIFSIHVRSNELFRGLTEMIRSGSYIQESIKNYSLISQNTKSDNYKINSLTKRELEVLIQVANGMFNKEIATTLNISERTVKNHMFNIFKKIEVSDRTQAAVFAIKNDLVNL